MQTWGGGLGAGRGWFLTRRRRTRRRPLLLTCTHNSARQSENEGYKGLQTLRKYMLMVDRFPNGKWQ